MNRYSEGKAIVLCLLFAASGLAQDSLRSDVAVQNEGMSVQVDRATGSYTLRSSAQNPSSLSAGVGAKINGTWITSSQYPQHTVSRSEVEDELGRSSEVTVTHSGLPGQPDLICHLALHNRPALVQIRVEVKNTTAKPANVQGIRILESDQAPVLVLGGPESSERVLSDSWSEDRPEIRIHDLADATQGMHRGVGSQLIYNRDSKRSFFIGALTSEKWATLLRLKVDSNRARAVAYEVDSAGTTELTQENSLRSSPPEDRVELSLSVASGETLSSERVIASFSDDYFKQLDFYGQAVKSLHHARVTAPTPIGWWSWTAYYFGLNEGAALTNAQFLAQRLKDKGYEFFHIDEGYQYARGEYATTNAGKFPNGMRAFESEVQHLGLTPGIWTAPFEVSERSWVYENHKDWLVRNQRGEPIHAGRVTEDPQTREVLDHLYVLDATNPGAQEYIRKTYTTLAKDWGIRYIKLDFMEDSAVEGVYFRANTTALEAQRIGLQVIRDAVGDHVLLDKDGSPMLNPVGLVDTGRISLDTGHKFEASRDAASGIAARYYMNRNFFVNDPDAFSVSRQAVVDQDWHGGKRALTLDEARVSIALAAVSGGMFEIGDDLPTLFMDAERMALVENRDLINMARSGRASKPLDLMSYAAEDEIPSVYLLPEGKRQAILTVFNWTEEQRSHRFALSELGFREGNIQIEDILDPRHIPSREGDSIALELAPRSVRMLKITDSSVPPAAPAVRAQFSDHILSGRPARFSAIADADGVPALTCSWDFGDGTTSQGAAVAHTFTHQGVFNVRLRVEGSEGVAFENSIPVNVTGYIDTRFRPEDFKRAPGP
jgi:alpha-galactosidase